VDHEHTNPYLDLKKYTPTDHALENPFNRVQTKIIIPYQTNELEQSQQRGNYLNFGIRPMPEKPFKITTRVNRVRIKS
jgi:hypothetical protein